jgi:hypothetical protein
VQKNVLLWQSNAFAPLSLTQRSAALCEFVKRMDKMHLFTRFLRIRRKKMETIKKRKHLCS